MNPTNTTSNLSTHVAIAATLARLLERMERSAVAVDPHQYRSVSTRLAAELRALQAERAQPALDQLLAAFPAAAELYENLNYEVAGLCRSDLGQAVSAETATRALLARLQGAGS